jgi:hypothetical protein
LKKIHHAVTVKGENMRCNRVIIELYDLGVVDIKRLLVILQGPITWKGHYAISCESMIKQIYRSSQMPLNATLEEKERTLHCCVNMARNKGGRKTSNLFRSGSLINV